MDRIYIRANRVIILLLLITSSVWSAEKEKVNILSWWGYLSADGIKSVEKKCNVELYVDEYYSNSEFLRRWDENPKTHKLVIFSNTIFNVVKEKLNHSNIPGLINSPYHPLVAEKVKNIEFNKNTRILTLAFTGIMWNKKNININDGLSLENMLDLAKSKIVVVLDDATEGLEILENLKFFQANNSADKNRAKVVIANEVDSLVMQPNFAFSYHWLGGLITAMKDLQSDFGLMVHPKLSHVTADLISIMNSDKASVCVYNQIASPEFLSRLQKTFFYFSPYGGINKDDNKHLVALYNNYFLNLSKYRWLKQPEKKDFKMIDDRWKKLKIEMSK